MQKKICFQFKIIDFLIFPNGKNNQLQKLYVVSSSLCLTSFIIQLRHDIGNQVYFNDYIYNYKVLQFRYKLVNRLELPPSRTFLTKPSVEFPFSIRNGALAVTFSGFISARSCSLAGKLLVRLKPLLSSFSDF